MDAQTTAAATVTVEYPGGFSEPAEHLKDAELKLAGCSHSGRVKLRKQIGAVSTYEEFREIGPDGRGWYFAGRIYFPAPGEIAK